MVRQREIKEEVVEFLDQIDALLTLIRDRVIDAEPGPADDDDE